MKQLVLRIRSRNRAGTGARAAVDASIGVDHVFTITSGDGGYRTFCLARAIADALVANYICHWKHLLKVYPHSTRANTLQTR